MQHNSDLYLSPPKPSSLVTVANLNKVAVNFMFPLRVIGAATIPKESLYTFCKPTTIYLTKKGYGHTQHGCSCHVELPLWFSLQFQSTYICPCYVFCLGNGIKYPCLHVPMAHWLITFVP